MTEPGMLVRRFALALCAYREASNQSMLGKLLVAQTIENRVQDARWPESYIGVITQRLQFSSFNPNDPNATRWPREDEDAAWADSVAAADLILAAPSKLTEANHYHATGVTPAWADPARIVQREGAHIFYKL